MPPARLITLPLSHFCEKARWALDRSGLPYVEEGHGPLFHLRATRPLGGRSTPMLVDGHTVLTDSTPILVHVDTATPVARRLFPADPALRAEVEQLEGLFDHKLGPATRRFAYFHVLPNRGMSIQLLCAHIPRTEAAILRVIFPAIRFVMQRSMRIDATGAERSRGVIESVFAEVARRLADGRRYLVGSAFSAADLTFAALSAPIVLPPEYGGDLPEEAAPPAYRALVEQFRATPAGAFALRLYQEERR